MRPFVCGLMSFALWTRYSLVFGRSLSNFTCKLWMMKGGTLLILGQRSRSILPPARGCHTLRCLVEFWTTNLVIDTVLEISNILFIKDGLINECGACP